jgi:hypothetical protein
MGLWNFETLHVIVLIRKRRYKFLVPLELVPWCDTGNPYGSIGDLAPYIYLTKIFQFQVRDLFRVLVLVFVLVLVLVHVLVRKLVRFRVRVKLNMALWMFLSDMTNMYIVDSQESYEVTQKLKGPLTWECMGKIHWKISPPSPFNKKTFCGDFTFDKGSGQWITTKIILFPQHVTEFRTMQGGRFSSSKFVLEREKGHHIHNFVTTLLTFIKFS